VVASDVGPSHLHPPRRRVRAFFAVVRGVRRVLRTESPDAALSFMAMANVLLGLASIGTGCRVVMSEHAILSLATPVASRWAKAFSVDQTAAGWASFSRSRTRRAFMRSGDGQRTSCTQPNFSKTQIVRPLESS